MRPSLAHGVGLGAVLFPPAPGVVRMYFVWEVILVGFRSLPYKLYGVFRHMFCMAKKVCIFPKVEYTTLVQ